MATHVSEILLISILGLATGFVNSISGGGGILAVPSMIAFGFSPINTLALNRISDVGYIAGCLKNYINIQKFDWKLTAIISFPLFLGAIAGSTFSVTVNQEILKWVMLVAVFIGVGFLLYPIKPKPEKVSPEYHYGLPTLLLVGFWSGALAMAGSTFAVLTIVWFFHRSYLSAKSMHVVASVPEIFVSATILSLNSTTPLELGFCMFASSAVGAWIGSHLAIKKGSPFIRYGMTLVSFVMIGKVIISDILHMF